MFVSPAEMRARPNPQYHPERWETRHHQPYAKVEATRSNCTRLAAFDRAQVSVAGGDGRSYVVQDAVSAGDVIVITDPNAGSLPQQLRFELTPVGRGATGCTAEVTACLTSLAAFNCSRGAPPRSKFLGILCRVRTLV